MVDIETQQARAREASASLMDAIGSLGEIKGDMAEIIETLFNIGYMDKATTGQMVEAVIQETQQQLSASRHQLMNLQEMLDSLR